jgi:hypothetical protein
MSTAAAAEGVYPRCSEHYQPGFITVKPQRNLYLPK